MKEAARDEPWAEARLADWPNGVTRCWIVLTPVECQCLLGGYMPSQVVAQLRDALDAQVNIVPPRARLKPGKMSR